MPPQSILVAVCLVMIFIDDHAFQFKIKDDNRDEIKRNWINDRYCRQDQKLVGRLDSITRPLVWIMTTYTNLFMTS